MQKLQFCQSCVCPTQERLREKSLSVDRWISGISESQLVTNNWSRGCCRRRRQACLGGRRQPGPSQEKWRQQELPLIPKELRDRGQRVHERGKPLGEETRFSELDKPRLYRDCSIDGDICHCSKVGVAEFVGYSRGGIEPLHAIPCGHAFTAGVHFWRLLPLHSFGSVAARRKIATTNKNLPPKPQKWKREHPKPLGSVRRPGRPRGFLLAVGIDDPSDMSSPTKSVLQEVK